MKKVNKFLWFLAVTVFLILCFYLYRYHLEGRRFFLQNSVKMYAAPNSGHSMGDTIVDGTFYKAYQVTPMVNDVIDFKCSADRCLKWGDNFTTKGHFMKRLTKIREDGAYWVDGDNKENSFDSDYYGWLLPSEVSDVWVVKLH